MYMWELGTRIGNWVVSDNIDLKYVSRGKLQETPHTHTINVYDIIISIDYPRLTMSCCLAQVARPPSVVHTGALFVRPRRWSRWARSNSTNKTYRSNLYFLGVNESAALTLP